MKTPNTSRRSLIGALAATPLAAATTTAGAAEPRAKGKARDLAYKPMANATITPWVATCAQINPTALTPTKSVEEARDVQHKAIAKLDSQFIMAAERRTDLILFPEYMLGSSENDLRGVVDFPGPEIERVQALAQKYKMFVGGHAYTRDAMFPGRYFNTSFLLDRSGNVVLKYHRIHTYHSHSPHDFWDQFLDKVGIEGAFPVARTELGNISMLPSMELLFPEMTRMLVMRGAEVLLHDTNEQICDVSIKRTRATENLMFVMSTNTTASVGQKSLRVGSRIIDWEGEVLAEVPDGVAGQCTTILDVEALRQRRANPDIILPVTRGLTDVNYLNRFRAEICRDVYNATSLYPMNTYKEGAENSARVTPEVVAVHLKHGIENMAAAGMIPAKYVKK